jgi:hypothetical protein
MNALIWTENRNTRRVENGGMMSRILETQLLPPETITMLMMRIGVSFNAFRAAFSPILASLRLFFSAASGLQSLPVGWNLPARMNPAIPLLAKIPAGLGFVMISHNLKSEPARPTRSIKERPAINSKPFDRHSFMVELYS